jgi:hypothetical protein
MVEFTNPIRITPPNIDAIRNRMRLLPDMDHSFLDRELAGVWLQLKDWNHDYELGPSSKRARDLNLRLLKETRAHVSMIEDQYFYEYDDMGSFYSMLPPELEKVRSNLRENEQLLKAVEERRSPVRTGIDPNPSFSLMVLELAEIFVRHTGQEISTNGNESGTDSPIPEFQLFAEECYVGFGFERPPGFDRKLHGTVVSLRKEGKIPRNPPTVPD